MMKANVFHGYHYNFRFYGDDTMDMNLLKYMAFIQTVTYGSFTKVAEMLNYSQSGISRMISDLEKEWHVVLLVRSRAGIRLTSDGTKLLPYAKSLCYEYQKLQTQVDGLNGLQSGLIRIGTFSSVATHWLPNIIWEFQEEKENGFCGGQAVFGVSAQPVTPGGVSTER